VDRGLKVALGLFDADHDAFVNDAG
jgi:hypothetical protein